MQAAVAGKLPQERALLNTPEARERLLDDMVRFDLLVAEAERRGYATHPEVIEAAKRTAIETLVARDFSVEPQAISKEDLERFWQENQAKYQRPARRRAAHIEVATEAEAKALIAQLRGATREQFSKVAGERSLDQRTRRQGGELGYFESDGKQMGGGAAALPPELVQAAFALKRVGEIAAKPIAHAGVFSVLMLNGEMPGAEVRLADVEEDIRNEIAAQRTRHAREALVSQLEAEQKPVVQPALVDAIELDPVPAPAAIPQGFPAAPVDPRAPLKQLTPDKY